MESIKVGKKLIQVKVLEVESNKVKVSTPMIESKLSFPEIQIDDTLGASVELGQPLPLRKSPKTLKPFDALFINGVLIQEVIVAHVATKFLKPTI